MVAQKPSEWLPAGWTVQSKVQKSGRNVKYYTNLKTGKKCYSKNEVTRYINTGSSRRHTPQPINRSIRRPSTKKDMQLVAKTNESPEWLPKGWIVESKTRNSGSQTGRKYTVYIDPSTGHRFYSKPQVIQYQTVKLNDHTSKQKKKGTGRHSASNVPLYLKNKKRNSCTSKQKKIGIGMPARNVVVEKVKPDGLPPGWILEIKIKKDAFGNRRDPFYTDPVTGYVFRSKKDVLRYLETGEISRHAFKPKKRGNNDLELINNEISSPSAAKRRKLTHHAARRQLFAGKGSTDMCSLVLPEAEGSRKTRDKRASAETTHTSAPTAEIIQEKHSLENVTEKRAETGENSDPSSSALSKARGFKRKQGKRVFDENGTVSTPAADIVQEKKLPGNATVKCDETRGNSDPSSSPLPKAKGFKRKQGKRVFDENGPVSTPVTDFLTEKKLLGNGIGKQSSRKAQISSINSKKNKKLNLPCRSSKRLAGLEPELVVNSKFSERALRVAARKAGETGVIPALGVALNNVAHRASLQLDAEPETEVAHYAFRGMETPLDSKKPIEDQAVPVERLGNLEPEKKDEKKPEPQLIFPSGDFWSDPCLEFAFKTLTGAIPVEDNFEIQDFFQQQLDTPHVQRDGGSTLPDFGLPDSFQSDISTQFDSPEKHVPRQQLPLNPSFLPPGNVSLPSCSGISPQQPSLEGNKNNQRKVH